VDVDLRDVHLHTDGNGLPIHGTMTAQRGWQTVALEAGRRVARLVTTFVYDRPELLVAFPFPHRLTVDASVTSRGLRVATTLSPTGDAAVPVSFGFHPYFRLPPPRAAWRLRMPACRHLELDARGIPTGASQPSPAGNRPIGDRTFDDLFALGADRRLRLESRGRRIEVELGGDYPYSQLFAPPGKPFACIEAMTAPTDGLVTGECPVVEPGGSFTAVFTIRLS
jgi:galactose mutarotase-like enzyme